MATKNPVFEHLALVLQRRGRANLPSGGGESEQTKLNKQDRTTHAQRIRNDIERAITTQSNLKTARQKQGLPVLPSATPLLLQVDPSTGTEYLRTAFNFEVVGEQVGGLVIVATEDASFNKLSQCLDKFTANERGGNSAAKLYGLHGADETSLRLQQILSESLLAQWENINNETVYTIDIGIECLGDIVIPDHPERKEDDSEDTWNRRVARWQEKKQDAYIRWDELRMKREDEFVNFASAYEGEIVSMIDGECKAISMLPDSFTVRLKIKGAGLKDIALNFPYIFEIVEPPEIDHGVIQGVTEDTKTPELKVYPPAGDAPSVCVIDSGIQEGHRLLKPAIDTASSSSFVPGDPGVADYVPAGGHGTRVAGAVLFPKDIPTTGDLQLPFRLQNARVLDNNNSLSKELFPPVLLQKIVDKYHAGGNGTRLFNHSISSKLPCRLQYMSSWAAAIDELSTKHDVLFIQAAGNLRDDHPGPIRLGVRNHLSAGRPYPNYLLEKSCRIADPAQSFHALTVGSIGHQDRPSAFTTTGYGLWSVVKPDVVEYGGDLVINPGLPPTLTTPPEVCPPLVRSTQFEIGPEWARDDVGTSFAAPKVAHIAAHLQKLFPSNSTLTYRALIAQSARWPDWTSRVPDENLGNVLRTIGYGVPDIQRASENTEHRVTLKTDGHSKIKGREAHIYRVTIPESLRAPGLDQRFLLEVTLAYVSHPRRTRSYLRNYLSTWVDWKASNEGESAESFADRVLYEGAGGLRDGERGFPWFLGGRINEGRIYGVRRSSGSLQKDWAFVRAYQLPSSFCIAAVGHYGWNKDPSAEAKYALVVSIEAVNKDIEVYEPIRVQLEAEIEAHAGEVETDLGSGM